MMRTVTARSDMPHHLAIPTRWADNDVYGHVNNVEFYAFFDTVINAYLIEAGLDIHGGPVIGLCVESHCEFRAALTFPEVIEVGLRVGRLGKSSVRYELAIFREGGDEVTAEGHFVHVFVDRENRRPQPIPPQLRGALERLQVPAEDPEEVTR
jgi:acyl-CoA thioester hydrolase